MMNRLYKGAAVLVTVVVVFVMIFFSGLFPRHTGNKKWKLPTGSGTHTIAIGVDHGVILASDGSLWTWGETRFSWHVRSEEHTSELQSHLNIVCRLLLEKKKNA